MRLVQRRAALAGVLVLGTAGLDDLARRTEGMTGADLERICTEAARAAKELDSGSGVVMKVASPDILHKSDAGGVVLGLKKADDVRRAFDDIV